MSSHLINPLGEGEGEREGEGEERMRERPRTEGKPMDDGECRDLLIHPGGGRWASFLVRMLVIIVGKYVGSMYMYMAVHVHTSTQDQLHGQDMYTTYGVPTSTGLVCHRPPGYTRSTFSFSRRHPLCVSTVDGSTALDIRTSGTQLHLVCLHGHHVCWRSFLHFILSSYRTGLTAAVLINLQQHVATSWLRPRPDGLGRQSRANPGIISPRHRVRPLHADPHTRRLVGAADSVQYSVQY